MEKKKRANAIKRIRAKGDAGAVQKARQENQHEVKASTDAFWGWGRFISLKAKILLFYDDVRFFWIIKIVYTLSLHKFIAVFTYYFLNELTTYS